MIPDHQVKVVQHDFSKPILDELQQNSFALDLWPMVYILSDGKKKLAYVGETTDAINRLSTHLNHQEKKKLSSAHLISSKKFNKSATLDIESNLIKYLSGDGSFQLLNANVGLANHNYYQKQEVYWHLFTNIWDKLRSEGIVQHSIDHINNSDLFKYSPYKSLTREQIMGLKGMLQGMLEEDKRNILIEGSAGTGKTILAIFFFKLLMTDLADFHFGEFGDDEIEMRSLIIQVKEKWEDPSMALVVPMSSFRKTLKNVFKNIKGLKANMVIGPADVVKKSYDVLLVDESHRLRKRKNLGTYFGRFDEINREFGLDPEKTSELDWVKMQSQKTILFYDQAQSIKPSDVDPDDFLSLKLSPDTIVQKLKSQFRVKGGNAYVRWAEQLLNGDLPETDSGHSIKGYDLRFFDHLPDMVEAIQSKNEQDRLSRLIAGYSWPWKSKRNPSEYDIEEDGIQLRWNSTTSDWINSAQSSEEVGCIHTTQGYDLNYAGIIFGHEIDYDPEKNEMVIIQENYHDKNGKISINDPLELKQFILNIYKTILLRGIKGTFVYACNSNLRNYLRNTIEGTAEEKQENSYTILPVEEVIPFQNNIPIFDLRAAAGEFGDLQNPSEISWISVPDLTGPLKDFFACKVIGKSMNKIIPDGALCLFKKYSGGSRNGLIVLVEYTSFKDSDLGSCYTVKEYQSHKKVREDTWQHESIILKPLSTKPDYEPIVLHEDDFSAFRVIGVFQRVLTP